MFLDFHIINLMEILKIQYVWVNYLLLNYFIFI